jgi:uncharacterized membrane protein
MPLHPMIVHFPLVLALLMPLTIIYAVFIADKKNRNSKIWLGILVTAVALSATSFLSMELGEGNEEIVEKVVSEHQIEEHEESAETFTYSTVASVLLAGLVFFGKFGNIPKFGLILTSFFTLAMAFPTGHSGAELVYKYNAGAAYKNIDKSKTTFGFILFADDDDDDEGKDDNDKGGGDRDNDDD